MPTFAALKTPGGYKCGEVASAMQKAIRRGEEAEAIFWATELDLAGYGQYVFKRLRIIASEDVGLGDTEAVTLVHALHSSWVEMKKAAGREPEKQPWRLFLLHAVIVLVRAKKSRLIDNALHAYYFGERPQLEIPDHALDRHTGRGKRRGRDWTHFYDEAAKLNNEAGLPDPYEAGAREAHGA